MTLVQARPDPLAILLSATGTPACTSRSEHTCTEVAAYACRSTNPCPDPTPFIYWCVGRHRRYVAWLGEQLCTHCRRQTVDCWKVWPL